MEAHAHSSRERRSIRAEWRDAVMQSFPTRLVGSVARVALVTPCLLIGLACATPFPIENLEPGMTAESLRENFGEPRSVGMWPVESEPGDLLLSFDTTTTSWTYVHEMQDWFSTFITSTVFLPHCALLTAVTMPFGVDHDHWCSIGGKGIPTVAEGTVVLYFEEENLVRWAVIEPDWLARYFSGNGSSGYTYRDPFPSTMPFPTKDSTHHDRGHKHHHGHGC